jgi:hypothetical protein
MGRRWKDKEERRQSSRRKQRAMDLNYGWNWGWVSTIYSIRQVNLRGQTHQSRVRQDGSCHA